nr:VOC family protein [Ignatzschineria rhizosphaerae]
MKVMTPIAVLIHVQNVQEGLKWYKKAFPMAEEIYLPAFDFTLLSIGTFSIEIVQADAKVGQGKCGSVLYWLVEDFDQAIEHFERLGAKLYRGPMMLDQGMRMCQVEDPFGNLIGLKGL